MINPEFNIVIENYVDFLKDFDIMEMATNIVKYGGVTEENPKLFADRKGFAALCSIDYGTFNIQFKYHNNIDNDIVDGMPF